MHLVRTRRRNSSRVANKESLQSYGAQLGSITLSLTNPPSTFIPLQFPSEGHKATSCPSHSLFRASYRNILRNAAATTTTCTQFPHSQDHYNFTATNPTSVTELQRTIKKNWKDSWYTAALIFWDLQGSTSYVKFANEIVMVAYFSFCTIQCSIILSMTTSTAGMLP